MTTDTFHQTYDQALAELKADRGDVANYLREMAQAVDHELARLMKPLPAACQAGTCKCAESPKRVSRAADALADAAMRAAIHRAMNQPAVIRAVPPLRVLPDSVLRDDLTLRLKALYLRRRAALAHRTRANPGAAD